MSVSVSNAVKALKKVPPLQYDGQVCMELFEIVDSSFTADSDLRQEIGQVLVNLNYTRLASNYLKFYTREKIFEGEFTWPCCFHLLRSIWNYSDVNRELAIKCTDLLPHFVYLLTADLLEPLVEEEDEKLLKIILNIMNNMAHHTETKVAFQEYQIAKILKSWSTIQHEFLKVLIYLVLAQIVSENDFNELNDPTNEAIENITFYIKRSIQSNGRYRGISTNEYLECMSRLAVTKDNQFKMVQCGMIKLIATILNEKSMKLESGYQCLLCIWNLCFQDEICELIKSEECLLDIIIAINNTSKSDNMRQIASGILFTMNELQRKKSQPDSIKTQEDCNGKHIMISYNHASKETCLKIKQELESKGYRVWIDVEQMYGSSLESMANAIEDCSVFLMCVSEKYFQSPNCRLEAEYAIRLRKPIVPLIMDEGYSPLGWLGIIMGDKIYYKFAPPEPERKFEESFPSLMNDISRQIKDSKTIVLSIEDKKKAQSSKRIQELTAKDWDNEEVKKWVESLEMSAWIAKSNMFSKIDGAHLKELANMKKTAPEAFFNMVLEKFTLNENNEKKYELFDVLKFSNKLTELFTDN